MIQGFEIIKCPICGSEKHDLHLKTFDRFAEECKDEFEIVKCSECNFIFLNPRPGIDVLGNYYDVDGYDPFISEDKEQSLRDKFYMALRNYNLSVKHRKIKKYKSKPGKILDIGCATGEFLENYQKYFWQCTGVEVDDGARTIAKNKNIKVFSSVHGIPETEKFDIITMWHVLEHVHDLNETVEKIRTLLKDDGILVIAVPNIEAYDAKIYKQEWVALDTPRHLYHYSIETIQKLFRKYNIKLINKHTLLLDNLYNNLLSKQLAKTGFISFGWTLLGSLLKTYLVSNKNSSSLVYYFTKELNNE